MTFLEIAEGSSQKHMGFHSFVICTVLNEVLYLVYISFLRKIDFLQKVSKAIWHKWAISYLFYFYSFFLSFLHRANFESTSMLRFTAYGPQCQTILQVYLFLQQTCVVFYSFSKGWYFSPIKNLLKGEFQLFLHLTKDGRFLRNHSYFILLFRT